MRRQEFRKIHPEPERPSFYMGETVRRLGLDFTDQRLRLFAEWEDLGLGEAGLHSRPAGLERGRLTVEALNGAWAVQLQFKTAEIKNLIKAKYPSLNVRTVRVVVGSWA